MYDLPLLTVSNVNKPCQLPLKCKAFHPSFCKPSSVARHQAPSQCPAVTSLLWQPRHVDKKIARRPIIKPAGGISAMPPLSLGVKYNRRELHWCNGSSGMEAQGSCHRLNPSTSGTSMPSQPSRFPGKRGITELDLQCHLPHASPRNRIP